MKLKFIHNEKDAMVLCDTGHFLNIVYDLNASQFIYLQDAMSVLSLSVHCNFFFGKKDFREHGSNL